MTSPLCWKETQVKQTLPGEAMLPPDTPGRRKSLLSGSPTQQDGGKVPGTGDDKQKIKGERTVRPKQCGTK
ncbi:unnamed protein product [Caretta caretta]